MFAMLKTKLDQYNRNQNYNSNLQYDELRS